MASWILILAFGTTSFAQQLTGLEVYTRTDAPAGWTGSPLIDGGWTQQGVGSTGSISIPANGSVFFAFENEFVEGNTKAFNVEFSAAHGDIPDLTVGSASGFKGEDTTAPVVIDLDFQKSQTLGLINVNVIFSPQPEWETVEIQNTSNSAKSIEVQSCGSNCSARQRTTGDNGIPDSRMHFSESMFGAEGLLPNTARFTQIEIYPRNVNVDLNAAPLFFAPPHTGNWNFDFTFVDPEGIPRPSGGVRFVSDGPGLINGETHEFAITMTDTADSSYDVFVFDESVVQHQRHFIDTGDLPWFEDFETHYPDTSVGNWRDWQGWDNDPAFDAEVTQAQAHGGTNSLVIDQDSDLVRQFDGADSGLWHFTAWQYIPADFESGGSGLERGSWFLLLNTYQDSGPYNWTVGMQVDSVDGLMKIYHGDGNNTVNIPYETDRWAKIESIINLDSDWTRIYYDDQFVAEYSWTGGIFGEGGGSLDIAAVDLFANGSSPVFYDDLSLITLHGFLLGDVNLDRSVNLLDVGPFIDRISTGTYQPEADTNQDGSVNLLDVGSFVDILNDG